MGTGARFARAYCMELTSCRHPGMHISWFFFIRQLKSFYFNDAFWKVKVVRPWWLPAPLIQCFMHWLCARYKLFFYDYDYVFVVLDCCRAGRDREANDSAESALKPGCRYYTCTTW